MFGLPDVEGVTVKVEEWKGELDHYIELLQVRLHLREVNSSWVEWAVLEQFASALGTLLDVDWQFNFKTFYEVVRIKIRCRDHTTIPQDRIFGIGEKLFKIKIAVEPPETNLDEDDLLDDDLGQNKGNQISDKDNDSTRKSSDKEHSTTTCKSGSVDLSHTSSHNNKQTALSYLQQLQDPMTMEQGVNLLQEMELDDEEEGDEGDSFTTNPEIGGDLLPDDVEEVIFCPVTSMVILVSQPEMVCDDLNTKGKSNWGPIQATRKSSRVEIGDRTMLEIAMDKQNVKNLEADKNSIKGTILKNSFDNFSDPNLIIVATKIGVEIDDVRHNSNTTISSNGHIHGKKDAYIDNLIDDQCLEVDFVAVDVSSKFNPELDKDVGFDKSNLDNTLDKPKGFYSPDSSMSSPITPDGFKGVPSLFCDQSVIWTKISKHKRGKHPKKKLFQ